VGGYRLGEESGTSVWESLEKADFAADAFSAARTGPAGWPNLFTGANGLLVTEDSKDKAVRFERSAGMSALIFVHHNRDALFFDILVRGVDHWQPYSDDGPTWKGTSVEIGASTNKHATDFEASLALTPRGPQVWVRKRNGRGVGAVDRDAYLKVLVFPESRMVTYHYALERSVLSDPGSDRPGVTLVLNSRDGEGIEIFEGVHARKAPELFGELRLV